MMSPKLFDTRGEGFRILAVMLMVQMPMVAAHVSSCRGIDKTEIWMIGTILLWRGRPAAEHDELGEPFILIIVVLIPHCRASGYSIAASHNQTRIPMPECLTAGYAADDG